MSGSVTPCDTCGRQTWADAPCMYCHVITVQPGGVIWCDEGVGHTTPHTGMARHGRIEWDDGGDEDRQ